MIGDLSLMEYEFRRHRRAISYIYINYLKTVPFLDSDKGSANEGPFSGKVLSFLSLVYLDYMSQCQNWEQLLWREEPNHQLLGVGVLILSVISSLEGRYNLIRHHRN